MYFLKWFWIETSGICHDWDSITFHSISCRLAYLAPPPSPILLGLKRSKHLFNEAILIRPYVTIKFRCFVVFYCLSEEKSWPIFYGKLLNGMGQNFLDIQYHVEYCLFLELNLLSEEACPSLSHSLCKSVSQECRIFCILW